MITKVIYGDSDAHKKTKGFNVTAKYVNQPKCCVES